MTASAVDVVNERWLLIKEGAYARQLSGFGGVMDRRILGHCRRHEPSRRINHARGIILAAPFHEVQHYAPANSRASWQWSGPGCPARACAIGKDSGV
jgi:hypothetical protein